jgi:arylsulfatase A-like enzyme
MPSSAAPVSLTVCVAVASLLNVALAEFMDGNPADVAGVVEALVWTLVPMWIGAIASWLALTALLRQPARASTAVGAACIAMGVLQPFGTGAPFVLAVLCWAAATGAVAWLLVDVPSATPGTLTAAGRREARDAVAVLLPVALLFALLGGRPERVHSLPAAGTAAPGAPPIVLIVVDTLRADAVDRNGPGGVPLMPAISELAAASDRYLQARVTAPWTKPTMASIMTGLHGVVHGAVDEEAALPAAVPTLAERLRSDVGYRTAAVVQNGFLAPEFGFDRGFEIWQHFPELPERGRSIGDGLRTRARPALYLENREITDRALSIARRWRDEPFFLWVHYFDPHLPYEPSADGRRAAGARDEPASFADLHGIRAGDRTDAARRQQIRALYDGETFDVDREVGRLLDGLRSDGLFDPALVILTSDHGEEFWEHAGFEHGHTVFDELLRVPLIVKSPGQTVGTTVEAPVSNLRLAANVLAAAGTSPDWPLAPLSPAESDGEVIVSRNLLHRGHLVAATDGTAKLMVDLTGTLPPRWFDLASDPGEQFPLQGGLGPCGRCLEDRLAEENLRFEQLRQQLGIESAETELDEALRDELRSLDYVR